MAEMPWQLIVHTIPEEKRKPLIEYCLQAQAKDPTFTFQEQDKNIIINCPNRDNAFRRGMLLHHRFGVFFEVVYSKTMQANY